MNSKRIHFLYGSINSILRKTGNGLLCLLLIAAVLSLLPGMPSADIHAEIIDEVEEIDLGDLNESEGEEEIADEPEEIDLGDLNESEEEEEIADEPEEIDLGDLNEGEEEEEIADEPEETPALKSNSKSDSKSKGTQKTPGSKPEKVSGSGFSWGNALWGNSGDPKKDEKSAPQEKKAFAAGKNADTSTESILEGLRGKKKTNDTKSEESAETEAEETPSVEYPLESLIPSETAIFVRISSIREFNARLEKLTETNFLRLLKSLGKGEYAKQLEPDRPIGVVLFPVKGAFQWAAFIPVKRYRKFAELLGADVSELPESIPDGTVSMLSPTLCAVPYCGHAVLAPNPMLLSWVQRSLKFSASRTFTPCAVKDPTVSIELTNALIQWLTRRGRIGLEEFAPVFGPEMAKLQENSEQMALAQQYFDRINESISWLDANIESARIDLTVGETESILSTAFLPKAGTRLAGLLQDPFLPLISTSLENENFLKVAPAYPASLIGQVDLPPATAERLKAPFNRIRHVEYSLTTPPENGSLAEGWCFFLEVDDAEAFVRETILPQAEEIGTKLGANTLGELGSEALQRNAERRLDRQMNRRRPPRRYADPEKASERGQVIGSLIGGLVGKAVASKEALKKQDLMGFDLYVSDLVQFTQLKKLIRQQEEGTAPPASAMFQNADPGQMVGKLIDGIISGEANLDLQELMGGGMNGTAGNLAGTDESKDAPLAATRNFMVVLDPNHLLVVPGNDAVLFDAVRLWNFTRAKYLSPAQPKTPEELAARRNIPPYMPNYQSLPPTPPREEGSRWHESWQNVRESIEFPGRHHVRFASVLSPEETMRTLEFASRVYGFEIPQNIRKTFPAELPPILSVYTTSGNAGSTFTTLPHEMSRSQFQKLIANLPMLLAK